MTNYSERLDEVLGTLRFGDGYSIIKVESPFTHNEWSNREDILKAKQAITSLIKELVAEVKPAMRETQQGSVTIYGDLSERELNIIDQFEQNLLKALEEA